MSTFPSVLTTYTSVLANERLNAPSHSGVENAQSGGLAQVEAVIGVEGVSSVVGSLQYLIKSPASDGGGHVQSANKGGTGQTSYNKGDILVASSNSVLSKVAVGGVDGQALVADSTQTSGVNWKGVATEKNIQDQTYTYAVASVISASVYGITFPTAVSVLSAGQAFAVKFPTSNTQSPMAIQVSSLLAQRIVNPDLSNIGVGAIQPSMIGIIENDGTNWQLVSNRQQAGNYSINADESISSWFMTNVRSPHTGTSIQGNEWTLANSLGVTQYANGAGISLGDGAYAFSTNGIGNFSGTNITIQYGSLFINRLKFICNPIVTEPGNSTFFGYSDQGTSASADASITSTTGKRIGFCTKSGNIYTICCDGTNITATLITTYSVETATLFEIIVNGTTNANFYINGVLVNTTSINLPTSGTPNIEFAAANPNGTGCGFEFISNMVYGQKL